MVASLTAGQDPNIPPVHAVMEHQGRPFYIREFVEGGTLEERVAAGSISPREGTRVLVAIAGAVARVHGRGVAHRNLHPANILVAADGVAKLIGFGRVGWLSGSGMLPPGTQGVAAEVDVLALQGMLDWLFSALGNPFRLPWRKPGDAARCVARPPL